MRSLTYHESRARHTISRIALQAELDEFAALPSRIAFSVDFRRRGGLGALRRAARREIGWFDGDKVGALGLLDSELFRARRLVVDTGLHAKQWTRLQAIDYGIKASEAERYVVMARPGVLLQNRRAADPHDPR